MICVIIWGIQCEADPSKFTLASDIKALKQELKEFSMGKKIHLRGPLEKVQILTAFLCENDYV